MATVERVTLTPNAKAAKPPVKLVREFFGMKLAEMKAEWMGTDETDPDKILTQKDKDQILYGLADGSYDY